jgi:GGDEF domain-containing protein
VKYAAKPFDREYESIYESAKPFSVPLSASVGFVSYNADKDLPIEDLISEADARMYEEKRLPGIAGYLPLSGNPLMVWRWPGPGAV